MSSLAGVLAAADGALQGPALLELEGGELAGGGQVGQPDGGEATGLDPAGVLDLLGAGEERDPADLLEVHADRVGRAAAAIWRLRRRPAAARRAGGRSGPGGRRRARGRPPRSRRHARPASRASCSSALPPTAAVRVDRGSMPAQLVVDGRVDSSR